MENFIEDVTGSDLKDYVITKSKLATNSKMKEKIYKLNDEIKVDSFKFKRTSNDYIAGNGSF